MKLFSKRSAAVRRTVLTLSACLGLFAQGCAAQVDLAAVPSAVAGCEAPTADELVPEAPMLPGRHCMACHNPSGQAGRRAWTAAGTVFDSIIGNCNTEGLDGVTVEILDAAHNDNVLITLTTNRTGNFFTAESINFTSIRARVSKDGKMRMMMGSMANADCPSCHQPGGQAGGRIYLN